MKKQYWLADGKEMDKYGTYWSVSLTDGPHDKIEGVIRALKIIKGIGLDKGKDRHYVMVTVEPVPDMAVKVNEDAIKTLKSIMPRKT